MSYDDLSTQDPAAIEADFTQKCISRAAPRTGKFVAIWVDPGGGPVHATRRCHPTAVQARTKIPMRVLRKEGLWMVVEKTDHGYRPLEGWGNLTCAKRHEAILGLVAAGIRQRRNTAITPPS